MRFITGLFFLAVFALVSCESEAEKAGRLEQDSLRNDSIVKLQARANYIAAVDSMEKIMASGTRPDPRIANAAMKAYNDFIVTFPDDTLTPEYLFLASNIAQGQQNYQQAAIFLETIIERHKGYRRYADACFVAAFVHANFLADVNHGDDRARQLYQYIIDNYPNTSYAEQSKVLITYVGKPDSVFVNDVLGKGDKQLVTPDNPSSGKAPKTKPSGDKSKPTK